MYKCTAGDNCPGDIYFKCEWSCLSRITKLENDIQKLMEKVTMEQETVQIDAPDFDPDIDRPDSQRLHHNTAVVSVQELFISLKPESIYAINTQEEAADSDQFNTGHSNSEDSHRPGNFPQQILDHLSEDNFTRQQHVTSINYKISDKIPLLEEDWKNGQFTDTDTSIINRHNTHLESERI